MINPHPDSLLGLAQADLCNKRLGEDNPLLPRARAVECLHAHILDRIEDCDGRIAENKQMIASIATAIQSIEAERAAYEDVLGEMTEAPESEALPDVNYSDENRLDQAAE